MSSAYCASFPAVPPFSPSSASRKFSRYSTSEQQKMYDAYLVKLNPKTNFSKHLSRKSLARKEVLSEPRPRTSDEERQRIRERYSEKAKERRVRMYEQALLMAEEREKEAGRKFRAQRKSKFHVAYQTYVSCGLQVGSSKDGQS